MCMAKLSFVAMNWADLSEILSSNHILAAVFRAVNDLEKGRLKTRNVHSEIVFALSPNNNVSVQSGRLPLVHKIPNANICSP